MKGAAVHMPLSIDALRQARRAGRLGARIEYYEQIDSTNTVAHRLARDGAPEGTVVIAEAQTHGRGRLGRTWVSPPFRNLYLSVILRPELAATDAPQVGLVAGLAVVDAARSWAPRAALKWPNDVVVDGRKLAGVLTEMDANADRVGFLVVGIGVNLNLAPDELPDELRDKAIGLSTAAHVAIDRVAFADCLLSRLEDHYALYLRDGFAAIRPLWEARSALTGSRVCVDDGQQQFEGVAMGIAADGSLRLQRDGHEILIVVGDVTLPGAYGGLSNPRSAAMPGAERKADS